MNRDLPLPQLQTILENTVFHRIRGECVRKGYTPDVLQYADNPEGFNKWSAALDAISKSPLGFAIEVFNNTNPAFKGLKKPPRIVILSEDYMPGGLGVDSVPRYEDNGTGFTEFTLPSELMDFSFSVHLIANNTLQLRTLTGLMALALPSRGYVEAQVEKYPAYGPFEFFIQLTGSYRVPSGPDELLETIYRYTITDLHDTGLSYVTNEGVAPLEEVTIEQYHGLYNTGAFSVTI